MAERGDVSVQTVVSGLSLLLNTSRALLEKAKLEAQESLENFVQDKITNLLGLISAGVKFYKSLGVKKRSEAESVWQRVYHHAEVRDQVEELLELESEWDSFIESVDEGLHAGATQSSGRRADSLSLQMPLTDGSSGKSVTLGHYMEQGQNLLLVLIRHYG